MNNQTRGLAEKPLAGPVVVLVMGLLGAYYVWLADPFRPPPTPAGPRAAGAAGRSPPARPPGRAEVQPATDVLPIEEAADPVVDGAGLVRAPWTLRIERHLDPGSAVAVGDVVVWLEGATDTKAAILTTSENIARYVRRIAAGTDVAATTRKLNEQQRRLDRLQERYRGQILTAPRPGVVLMISDGPDHEAGQPVFQILPD